MRFADYRLKSIQEAVNTAPQAELDTSHLDDKKSEYGASFEADPNYQQAMAKATAWEDSQKDSDNDDEEDSED